MASCTYRIEKVPGGGGTLPPSSKLGQLPGFISLAAPGGLLNSKCLSCHNADGRASDLTNYGVFKAQLAEIRDSIVSRRMPKAPGPVAPLTNDELNLLVSWIDAGAPETEGGGGAQGPDTSPTPPMPDPGHTPSTTPTPIPQPTPTLKPPTFAVLRPILETKCAQCHGPEDDFEIVDYPSAFSMRAPISRRINLPFNDRKRMPPARQTQLTDAELQLLNAWLEAGAPE